MRTPTLLVINQDKITPGGIDVVKLISAGLDTVWAKGPEAPAVQIIPSGEDRRFIAAVAAMQGILAGKYPPAPSEERAEAAVRIADALLAELAK